MPSRRTYFLSVLLVLLTRVVSRHEMTMPGCIVMFAWYAIVIEYFAVPIVRFMRKRLVLTFLLAAISLALRKWTALTLGSIAMVAAIGAVCWAGVWLLGGLKDVAEMIWDFTRISLRRPGRLLSAVKKV